MIHKLLNWLIGSTWEERQEAERLTKWRAARRSHWMSKISKAYWLKNTGFEEPSMVMIFSLMIHKKQKRMTNRLRSFVQFDEGKPI